MAKQEYVEPKTLTSLAELDVDGEAFKVDYTEDAWSYGAPPPAGVYKVKWMLDKDGLKTGLMDQRDPRSVYIQFNLIGTIQDSADGEFDGIPVFSRVNTKIYRGKTISTMAGFLSKCIADVSKIPNPVTPKKLAELTMMVLKKEPVVKTEVEWKGSYSYKDNKGEDKWENVYNSYAEFPIDNETKIKKHIVTVTSKAGGTAEVRAMLNVVRFYSKTEEVKEKKQTVVGANKTVAAKEPELELEDKITIAKPSASAPVKKQEEEDMDLILE